MCHEVAFCGTFRPACRRDLLFSVAQLARHLDMDPHDALRAANKKFLRRFHAMEDLMLKANVKLEEMNQDQMDVYWNQAKVNEKTKI